MTPVLKYGLFGVAAAALGIVCGAFLMATVASAHTSGASCVGSSAVFHGELYNTGSYRVDQGPVVLFADGFTVTVPNATTQHHVQIQAPDWQTVNLFAGPCVQPTTTTTETTTSTSTSLTTTTVASSSTTVPTSSTTAPDTTPSSTSSTPSPTTTLQPSTTPSTPTTAPPSTNPQPGEMCETSSLNSQGTADASTVCGASSISGPTTDSGPSTSHPTSSELPLTGPNDVNGPLIGAGAAALAAGGALCFVARRRRP